MTQRSSTAVYVVLTALLLGMVPFVAHAQGFFAEVSNASINGAGTSAVVTPGAQFEINADYNLWNSDGRPSCVAQLVIGTDDGTKECIYDGIPGVAPGQSGNATVVLVAPTAPGVYQLRYDFDLQFNCANAVSNWPIGSQANVIGEIVVASGGFFAQVSNANINGAGTSAVVAPGAQLDVNADFDLWNSDGCPFCVAQLVIGTDDGTKDCIYDDIPGIAPGQSGNSTLNLLAPTLPGVYQLRYDFDLQFNCANAVANWPTGAQTNVLGDVVVASTKRDMDGDGKADVLWRNNATGLNWLFQMNGAGIVQSGAINTVSDQNWKIVGNGDYNGDGKADMLWRNMVSGQNWMHLMNGRTILQGGPVNTVANSSWKVVGSGDHNGDGKSDILWHNSATGQTWLFQMNGTAVAQSGQVNRVSDLNWKVVGNGDHNGDGKADMLWRNSATGQNWLHQLDGASVVQSGPVNTVADLNWQVVGSGDHNGDGNADILWHNGATGQTWLFQMNGASVLQSGAVNRVSDLNWKVVGNSDYNGDRKADILWRNVVTGQNWMHQLNVVTVLQSGPINTVADLNWIVINPN